MGGFLRFFIIHELVGVLKEPDPIYHWNLGDLSVEPLVGRRCWNTLGFR